jgi:formylglycine-generating enzyme required for sulfatase activity
MRHPRLATARRAGLTLALLALAGAAPTTAPSTLSLDLGKGLTMDFVRVPAGTFVMGSPPNEAERDESEGPQHRVTIGRPFWIGRFEVTQAQWVALGFANQSQFKDAPGHDQLPCECVSWTDCQKFCDAASKATGRKFRLPSEAEWEYAARGGGTGTFGSVGDKLASTQANFNGNSPFGGAPVGPDREHPIRVGSFPPNGFGLCDVAGNVSEWCQDVYHDSYAGGPTDGSDWETGDRPTLRVYRGGAYNNDASSCRNAVRYAAEQGEVRNSTLGFRVVVDDGAK